MSFSLSSMFGTSPDLSRWSTDCNLLWIRGLCQTERGREVIVETVEY